MFWIAKNAKLVEGNLYKLFKNDLDREPRDLFNKVQAEATKAIDYAADIKRYLTPYLMVADPNVRDWKGDKEIKDSLYGIKLAGGKDAYPLLVAMLLQEKKVSGESAANYRRLMKKTIEAIESYVVRNHICGQKSTSEIPKIYVSSINEIRQNGVDALSKLIGQLRNTIPPDAIFESRFAEYSAKRPLAMYLLHKIERHHAARKEPVSRDSSEVNLEHIMPRKIGNGWTTVRNYHKEYLERLGNLTLISKKLNLTNSGFIRKRNKYYKDSNIEITKQLIQFNQWRKKEIQQRQRELARVAIRVWSI